VPFRFDLTLTDTNLITGSRIPASFSSNWQKQDARKRAGKKHFFRQNRAFQSSGRVHGPLLGERLSPSVQLFLAGLLQDSKGLLLRFGFPLKAKNTATVPGQKTRSPLVDANSCSGAIQASSFFFF